MEEARSIFGQGVSIFGQGVRQAITYREDSIYYASCKRKKSISGPNQTRDLINHKVRFPLATFPYFQDKGRIFIKAIQYTYLLILSFVTFALVSIDFFLC